MVFLYIIYLFVKEGFLLEQKGHCPFSFILDLTPKSVVMFLTIGKLPIGPFAVETCLV